MGKDKAIDKKEIFAVIIMAFFFILIHGLALLITGTFEEANMQAFEDPDNPINIAYIFVIMIVFTAIDVDIKRIKEEIVKSEK